MDYKCFIKAIIRSTICRGRPKDFITLETTLKHCLKSHNGIALGLTSRLTDKVSVLTFDFMLKTTTTSTIILFSMKKHFARKVEKRLRILKTTTLCYSSFRTDHMHLDLHIHGKKQVSQ